MNALVTPDGRSWETAWTIPIHPDPGDFDERGHVNNTVYVRWVQDAATSHWVAVAPPDVQVSTAWVVRKHEIEYLSAILPGDAVWARTWVGGAEGVLFERFTEITRGAGEVVAARARTLWCPVDPISGRILRLPPQVRTLVSTRDVHRTR